MKHVEYLLRDVQIVSMKHVEYLLLIHSVIIEASMMQGQGTMETERVFLSYSII